MPRQSFKQNQNLSGHGAGLLRRGQDARQEAGIGPHGRLLTRATQRQLHHAFAAVSVR